MQDHVLITGDNIHLIQQMEQIAPSLGITITRSTEPGSNSTGSIWVSEKDPPEGTRVWIRSVRKRNVHEEINEAHDQRIVNRVDMVGVVHVTSRGPVAEFHIAVTGIHAYRSFQNMIDFFSFTLEYATGSSK